jgi:signal transduction histidine kinase
VALLRTAQEALNNVRRHSGATSAELLVEIPAGSPPLLRLTVTDNGQGFDTAAGHQGFGLKSMSARLDEIGGRLQVTSSPAGTRLVAEVPTAAPGLRGADAGLGTHARGAGA